MQFYLVGPWISRYFSKKLGNEYFILYLGSHKKQLTFSNLKSSNAYGKIIIFGIKNPLSKRRNKQDV